MAALQLEDIVRDYLKAFEDRDLERCMTFFGDDVTVYFQNSVYRGTDAVRDWHKERFDADFRLVQLDSLAMNGESVTVDGVATSKRLRAWKIKNISGTMTVHFSDGLICDLEFGARLDRW
jgi:hypothetical protein